MRAGSLPAAIAERGSIMSNELKLYHSVASPNSRRVRMFLAEKDIAIALVQVDLVKGEQHSDGPTARLIRDESSPHSCWRMAQRSVRFSRFGVISKRFIRCRRCGKLGRAAGPSLRIPRPRRHVGSTPREKALVTMWERRA